MFGCMLYVICMLLYYIYIVQKQTNNTSSTHNDVFGKTSF
jgi:hypothetical protein